MIDIASGHGGFFNASLTVELSLITAKRGFRETQTLMLKKALYTLNVFLLGFGRLGCRGYRVQSCRV